MNRSRRSGEPPDPVAGGTEATVPGPGSPPGGGAGGSRDGREDGTGDGRIRPADPVEVRPADRRHLSGIVRCHQAAFPGQFLTRLGPGFLAAYYRYYLDSPRGINLVATGPGDRVVGFVSGGDPALRGRFIRSQVPRYAGLLLFRGVLDPFVRRRLRVHLGNLARIAARRLGRAGGIPAGGGGDPDPEGASVLLSIAVDPSATGRGIGRMLMEAFRRESRRLGYPAMVLSAHADNDPAIRLYLACGWEVVRRDADGVYFRRSTDP